MSDSTPHDPGLVQLQPVLAVDPVNDPIECPSCHVKTDVMAHIIGPYVNTALCSLCLQRGIDIIIDARRVVSKLIAENQPKEKR